MKLNLTPRLECGLCGAVFKRMPADEHDLGQFGRSATGLCSGCATDHPREFVRFWRLGFRDYAKEQVRRHKGRDVPDHLAHAYDVGWAAAELEAELAGMFPPLPLPRSASHYVRREIAYQRRGWAFGAAMLSLNDEEVQPVHQRAHSLACRAGQNALSEGTDRVLSALGLPAQQHLTAQDFPQADSAMDDYQRAIHGEDW